MAMRSRCRRLASSELEPAAAVHDLVVALVELAAGELVEAARRCWPATASTKASSWRSKASKRAPDRAVRARSQMGRRPAGCRSAARPAARRSTRLVQEDMQVARRGAFAGQPLGFGRRARAPTGPSTALAEQAEGRAQPAQRHPGLVDADRPAARQHDGAILQQVGMARRPRCAAARHRGRCRGRARCQVEPCRPDRSGRPRPGNRKERQSDEGFISALGLRFAGLFR